METGFHRCAEHGMPTGRRSTMKPEFFKVLIASDCMQRLSIPPAFVEQIASDWSEGATLKGPSGQLWHMKIKIEVHRVFFEDGWEIFAKDHCLNVGYFLVFRYEGNMNFTVRIFDTRACWDEHAFIVTSSQEPPNNLASNWFEQQNNKTTRDKASSPNPDKSSESVRAIARGKAYAFHSHKPYFVAEIKASNVGMPCCFHIKRSFAKYLPKHQEQIVLRVPEGGRWEVNYYYTERNKGLYGGWSAFSRDNNLIEGDYCVFELVNELEMMVYIFR